MSSQTLQESAFESVKNSVKDLLIGKPHLQFFCNERCVQRYLAAREGDPVRAAKLLRQTLEWREVERMHEVFWDSVAENGATGKIMRAACSDAEGRPVLVLRCRFENEFKDHKANLRHFRYQIEMAARCADRQGPDGKLTCILDYKGFNLKNNPPLTVSKAVLQILQCHYPERLHEAILWHPPKLFEAVWKVLYPFLDNRTRQKITFLMKNDKNCYGELARRVDITVLDKSCGGSKEDAFDLGACAKRMVEEEALYREEFGRFMSNGHT